MTKDQEQRVTGGFSANGAFGPTIFIRLTSQSSASWLSEVFLNRVASKGGLDLAVQDSVYLEGLEQLELHRAEQALPKNLSRPDSKAARFVWSCTDDGWRRNAGLLEPFIQGRTGHQYLTSEVTDDALLEISFGEEDSTT
jgi:hypothetical protein